MTRPEISGVPSWMNVSYNKKRTRLNLKGNSTWAGQPVINDIKVTLRGRDTVTGINIDRAMARSWRFNGTDGKNVFNFMSQAGAITKRTNSIINFGKDTVTDKFIFTNTTPKDPFNHMQRFVIKNCGKEDEIILKNIGRTFTARDLRSMGGDKYSLPGVSPTKLTVVTDLI